LTRVVIKYAVLNVGLELMHASALRLWPCCRHGIIDDVGFEKKQPTLRQKPHIVLQQISRYGAGGGISAETSAPPLPAKLLTKVLLQTNALPELKYIPPPPTALLLEKIFCMNTALDFFR